MSKYQGKDFSTTMAELRKEIGEDTMGRLIQNEEYTDEDGAHSFPGMLAELQLESGALLLAGTMLSHGAPKEYVIEKTLQITAKIAAKMLGRAVGAEVNVDTIGMDDAEGLAAAAEEANRRKPSEHNAQVAADILAEAEGKEKH